MSSISTAMSSIDDLKATISALTTAAAFSKKEERLSAASAVGVHCDAAASAEDVDTAIRNATLSAHTALQQAQEQLAAECRRGFMSM